jgi:hypothetical protein
MDPGLELRINCAIKTCRMSGDLVLISCEPEVLSIGTIETENSKVQMVYDPFSPTGSIYLMSKSNYEQSRPS